MVILFMLEFFVVAIIILYLYIRYVPVPTSIEDLPVI